MVKLGQHFLKNKNKIKKIVEALELKSGDVVIEIGPGHGELTNELRIMNNELRIIAIEKDRELVKLLRNKFKTDKNIEIIEGDVLKILPNLIKNLKLETISYKIVGNIPYYITGYLLRIIGELKNKPELSVLTVQKEVAERTVAEPPKNNLLAASVQFWAEPEIIDYVPKSDFEPQPKVDSAIVALRPRNKRGINAEQRVRYYKFIKILFKQPRKTILNNLRLMADNPQLLMEKLQKLGINSQNRPQNLTLEQIIRLSELI